MCVDIVQSDFEMRSFEKLISVDGILDLELFWEKK